MQTELKLPPSGRDFQVYQRVIVDAASTRQAASEFSLSQTRVRQVVQRVSEWLTKELPAASKENDQVQLWLAKHVAADRLQGLYGETMSGWRKMHDTKNFGMVLRLITAQSKLPAMPGTLEALAADAIEGPLERGVESRTSKVEGQPQPASTSTSAPQPSTFDLGPSTAIRPPVRACSNGGENDPSAVTTSSQPLIAIPNHSTTSAGLTEDVRAARKAFFGPAQRPAPEGDDKPVTELKIAPQQPGMRVERKLSRRERRRLAKLGA